MADKNFVIGASLEVDNNKIKTDFQKAGELAGESVAKGLESKGGDIQERMSEQIENLRGRLEELSNFDWELNVNTENAQEYVNMLGEEITDANRKLLEFSDELSQTGEDGGEKFQELQTETRNFATTLIDARQVLKDSTGDMNQGIQEVKEEVKKTTQAVEELGRKAEETAGGDTKGLGKMLKFLSSKEVLNFFYKNIKQIGEKLIELSGDGEKLAERFGPIKDKLEAVGGYIGKGLTPALEGVIDDIGVMTDELVETGNQGQNTASVLQKGVFIIGTAFRGLIKVIRSVGIFLGSVFGGLRPVVSGFFTDFYNVAKDVIEGIGDAQNWIALGNNIKYGVVSGVNSAIESVNGLLNWIRDKLGIDLGSIDTFDAGQKMEYTFDLDFKNTNNAIEAFKDTMKEGFNDIEADWQDFINDTKEGRKGLENTAISTNKKIKNNTKNSVGGGKKDSVKGAYEEMEEEAVGIWEELDKMVEDHQKKYDKLNEEIKKVEKEYDKLREEAKNTWEEAEKALDEYNKSLEKSQSEAVTNLGQRYVELKKELIGISDYMKKTAEELSWKELRMYEESGTEEYNGYKLKDLIDLKEKLEEIKLIEENTTEEQRKSEEFMKETSKTQEILNKLKEDEAKIEEQKAAALEKQAIAQAMMNQPDGKEYIKTLTKDGEDIGTWYYDSINEKWEQIHNVENIEYAKQLENQSGSLNDQLKQYEDEKKEEVEILIDTTARKTQLEEEFTKVFQENVKKQQKELDGLIQREQRLIDLRREYLSMGGSTGHNAYGGSILEGHASIVGENGPEKIIARQSSYVQPMNGGNSYSTTNTTNNALNISGIEVKYDSVDELLEALKERLTYRD